MWEHLARPWQFCLEEAWTAYCAGSLPIGAVIVNSKGEAVARGRSRRYEDDGFPFGAHNQEIMHAELQAILAMNDREVPRREAVLYTTMEPCPMCLGTWFMSNMGVLYYAARDPYAGSTDLMETTWYMRRKGKRAHGPADPWLEDIIVALHVEVEHRVRGEFAGIVLDRWVQVFPEAVRLGEALLHDGELRQMRLQAAPVSEAVNFFYKKREDFLMVEGRP